MTQKIEDYGAWFCRQTKQRQAASMEHMLVCRHLGEAQRRSPSSAEVHELQAKVTAYYLAEAL